MTRVGIARTAIAIALTAVGLVSQAARADATTDHVGARSARPAIASGSAHSCTILADGTAKCWGLNASGQLGNGTTTSSTTTPVSVSGLTSIVAIVAIAAGDEHSCAVLSNGAARCWGANAGGQLGNGTTSSSATPVVVSGITTAVAIATGSSIRVRSWRTARSPVGV
jgi:alpha-tubulin suppressor-like RCC1 family protein